MKHLNKIFENQEFDFSWIFENFEFFSFSDKLGEVFIMKPSKNLYRTLPETIISAMMELYKLSPPLSETFKKFNHYSGYAFFDIVYLLTQLQKEEEERRFKEVDFIQQTITSADLSQYFDGSFPSASVEFDQFHRFSFNDEIKKLKEYRKLVYPPIPTRSPTFEELDDMENTIKMFKDE